jgi:hypothetical protein
VRLLLSLLFLPGVLLLHLQARRPGHRLAPPRPSPSAAPAIAYRRPGHRFPYLRRREHHRGQTSRAAPRPPTTRAAVSENQERKPRLRNYFV